MTYLASPYTHPERRVVAERVFAVTLAAAILTRQGVLIYSPIIHNHALAQVTDLPTDWDFWKDLDREMIFRSDRLVVLCLAGWKISQGVTEEISYAKSINKPILYTLAPHYDFFQEPI